MVIPNIAQEALPNASEQGQPPTVPAHDLEHKGSRVRGSGRVDIIDRFADPLQRCRCADCHIGQTHVIVDGSDEADDAEVTMFGELFWSDLALGVEGL